MKRFGKLVCVLTLVLAPEGAAAQEIAGSIRVTLVDGSGGTVSGVKVTATQSALYEQYKEQVAFYIVYIREAHATDVWQDPDNFNVLYADPKSAQERIGMGHLCVAKLGIQFPAVVNGLDNSTERGYTAWPERLYVLGRDGMIAYKSGPGPYGFRPKDVSNVLKRLVPAELN